MSLYSFCGLTVEMEPQFSLLRERSKPYLLSEGSADIRMRMPADYLTRPRKTYPEMEPEWREYLYYSSLFYRMLLPYDGMMLHSSAVAVDGRAYLFSAPPGTGKSTHTGGWMRLFGERAVMINDDKPALRFFDGQLHACGTPFTGKAPVGSNIRVPVQGICILERGEKNSIRPVSPQEAMPRIYDQTIHRLTQKQMEQMLTTLEKILHAVPVWLLQCNISEEAVRLAYETMKESEVHGI